MIANEVKQLIAELGGDVTVEKADGSSKFKVKGVYSTRQSKPGANSLEIYTTRTLYIAGAVKFVPDVNDIVTIGTIKARVQLVKELSMQGVTVAYVLELM